MTRSSRRSDVTLNAPRQPTGAARIREDSDWLSTIRRLAGREIGEAASRVADLPASDLGIEREEMCEHLLWIAAASRGEDPDVYGTGTTMVLRGRIVDLLRAEIIRAWTEERPAADEMLETMQRLECAQRACVPSSDQRMAAELADRAGLDLVVEVAHDMRSPLTSILFLSEILHRGQSGAFNDVQKRQIGIIYSAALGLVGMASDMIEMARGGNRLLSRQAVPFSVNDVLQGVYELVRPTADEKRLALSCKLLEASHRVGYPVPLSRVLLNLTTNALKFTQEGVIEISATPLHGNAVEFAVSDTGPGIPPAAMETLYQPFRREPARETGYSFSGTGLGLAICRRLVDAMGSELHVDTRAQRGTRFYFRLDLPPAAAL